MPIGLDVGGLDLDRPEDLTEQEWAAFAEAHGTNQGYPGGVPPYRFWREAGRPSMIKRQRTLLKTTLPQPDPAEASAVQGRVARHAATPNWPSFTPGFAADLHFYILRNYQLGLEYETHIAAQSGYTKEEVLDVFAVANLHTCSFGYGDAWRNEILMERLRDFPEPAPDERVTHPEGWELDPGAFRSGVDFSTLDTSDEEVRSIRGWYQQVLGEIPGWAEFLARENPRLLKQMRNRFEHALKALPKQFMPFLQLTHALMNGWEHAVRENLLLARGFGVRRDQAIGMVDFAAATYGGPEALTLVERVGRDVLDRW